MTIATTQFPAEPMRSSSGDVLDPDLSYADLSCAALPCAEVSWRALSSGLWVARRDGRHLGTVQRGWRWLASDADSEPIGSFHTFPEAQAAVAGPAVRTAQVHAAATAGPMLLVAGLLAAAATSTFVWASAALLL